MIGLGECDVETADGRRIRSAAYGSASGFPVVWHHGNPGSRVAPVSEAVLRDCGVLLLTYDRPGGGRSDPLPGRRIVSAVPDIGAIADAWEIDRFGTAGFSGGGSFALATAAGLGDRVIAAAVLSGAAPIDAEGLDFTAGMTDQGSGPTEEDATFGRVQRLEAMEPTRQHVLSDPVGALRDFVAEWPAADREALLRPDIAAPIAEGMAECMRFSADGWLDDSVAFHQPWGFDVASVRVPVSIWHGKDDTAAPITHGRWLADHITGCQLHELNGGHYAAYLALPEALRWLTTYA